MPKPRLDRLMFIGLMAAAITACVRSPAPLPEVQTPAATLTPPPVPELVDIINPLISGRGSLPSRAGTAEIASTPHPSLAGLPPAQEFTSAIYAIGTEFVGRTSVFIYLYEEDLDAAWPLLLEQIVTPQEISGLGDLAAVDHSDLAFIRCSALVHIKLVGADPDELRTFAETLDARLTPVVCQ